ncbi:hypothetical protein TNCV_1620361 [Trichonephila clavipes]|nr:hypothetical protein TNCV_1620361 [Trichonephila clavipes]
MNKIRKTSARVDCLAVSSDEFRAVDEDNVYYDDENEINNAAPVPTSSEMRNIMTSMRSYLNTHSSGEKNNKMDDIEQFVDNLMLKETM